MDYEIIVVGGGHAGCEAALAASRIGHKTLLVTSNVNNIADMPCNPSIGGSAKGIVVREIDALGGQMGKCADEGKIQIKMLNNAKGPAVQALRAQADKVIYPKLMRKELEKEENLTILEGMVEDLIVEDNVVKGIILSDGTRISSKSVILTTGTYLKADIMVGDTRRREGPHGEKPSQHLSDNLRKYGLNIIRLKTGTPQRIDKSTIDYSKTRVEPGDDKMLFFSFDEHKEYDTSKQTPCHLIYTTAETKRIIKENLNKASMYGGLSDVTGVGPRYCPSIEDKIVRFSDKDKHQLFLEPESNIEDDPTYGNTIYVQGFSTSMPHDVQELMVHSLPGLENAKILKYAYAIEYDAIYPTQMNLSLENKVLSNLFTAGQINGTSGYEEAAGQGIIAGINAARKVEGKEPLILKRNEAYIGVLIDDLVNKGIKDPYRLLTSRAEYRLLLRTDNADLRLRKYGYEAGLISEQQMNKLNEKIDLIEKLKEELKNKSITPTKEVNEYLSSIGSTPLQDGIKLYDLLKRPEVKMSDIEYFIDLDYSEEVKEQVDINIKYDGYIKKAEKEALKMLDLDNKKIPDDIDYSLIKNIASEARQKLSEVRPTSIGQALRISGVNPADISILMVYLKKEYYYDKR